MTDYDVKDLHSTHRTFLPHIKSRPLPILLTFSFKQKLLQFLFLRTDEIEKDIENKQLYDLSYKYNLYEPYYRTTVRTPYSLQYKYTSFIFM